MIRYVSLLKFTDAGAREMDKSPGRAAGFVELAAAEGVEVETQLWTTGAHDGLVVLAGRTEEAVLRVLARLLPLADGADVYLLGTGLPSFWSVRLGEMRFLLGLSGWTANDWSGGSAANFSKETSRSQMGWELSRTRISVVANNSKSV